MDEHVGDSSHAPQKNVRLPMAAGEPPPLVPARMINETIYCERLLYLEWAQGEFADNVFTVDGRSVHERADQPGGSLPPARNGPRHQERRAAPGAVPRGE
jgi:hypothetical protein